MSEPAPPSASTSQSMSAALDPPVRRSLRLLMFDGACTEVLAALTSGAFLMGFALHLGATNFVVGLIAAVPAVTQVFQVPAILLIEKTRDRRRLAVMAGAGARFLWIVIAGCWLLPESARLPAMLGALFFSYALSAMWKCAFASWMRDLVPSPIKGRYFAKRLAWATLAAALATIAAGAAVDAAQESFGRAVPYSAAFCLAALIGLIGSSVLSRIHEPPLPERRSTSMRALLLEPFRDKRFRGILGFLAAWNFAVHLALPFTVVYMLRRLNMSIGWVVALAALSQVCNVLALPIWGRLADKLGDRPVVAFASLLVCASLAAWPMTHLHNHHAISAGILVAIHMAAGIANAGVALSTSTMAMRLAPRGRATSYLAAKALIGTGPAALAPILGGLAVDWLTPQQITVLGMHGLDFLFVAAGLLGLLALYQVFGFRDIPRDQRSALALEFFGEVRRSAISSAAGLRLLTAFPYALLRTRESHPEDDDDHSKKPQAIAERDADSDISWPG